MNCTGWSAHCPKCGWVGMLRQYETKEESKDAKLEWDLHVCDPVNVFKEAIMALREDAEMSPRYHGDEFGTDSKTQIAEWQERDRLYREAFELLYHALSNALSSGGLHSPGEAVKTARRMAVEALTQANKVRP